MFPYLCNENQINNNSFSHFISLSMDTLGTIITVAAAVVTVLGGVYAMFQFVFKIGQTKEHLENFENNTNKQLEKIDRRFEKIEDASEEHTIALTQVFTFLGQKYPKKGTMFLQKSSPRKLTELGLKIYNDINGDSFLAENKDILYEYIDKEDPKTRLDVESRSYMALMALSSDDSFNSIKDYIYEAPAIETIDGGKYELTLGDVCLILSIPLRDMYIKDRNIQ